MQPPTIPHRVDGYQVDKNFNKCLDCHARAKTEFSQAVPVSATHYIDRSGKVLDHISDAALLLHAVPCGAGARAARWSAIFECRRAIRPMPPPQPNK